ncbi:hypothetical protein [Roseateles amylovorans]|uniref:Glycine zipper domain-containing protein n=1 Tax=Roseateles amylovorans TaxID=2978473 RepID=A0ABY6B4X2_9BURK|nr:hypothetical protein [Roseateles amylovorans]UXH80416.1 hypothetical protein N4261_11295 [Roseateles amylovorans]
MNDVQKRDANLDPITKEPGAHPVGTGLGAVVGGMAAGAATGTVAGPLGTAVGAAVGAVVGGLAGKGVAEAIDPTAEAAYWRENYGMRPYVEDKANFDDYGPAYAYGVDAFSRYPDRDFDDFESELHRDWGQQRRTSSLDWDRARPAARDAWDRVKSSSNMPPATR